MEKLLGARAAAGTRAWRDGVARGLQEDAVAAVRAQAPDGFRILLHADPESYHCGANAGVDPAHILAVADGVVVPCTGGAELAAPFAAQGRGVVAANLTVVAGMGAAPARSPPTPGAPPDSAPPNCGSITRAWRRTATWN